MKVKLAFLAILFFGIFGMAQSSQAATYYIDPTCATPGNGTSPNCTGATSDPFKKWSNVVWAAGNSYLQKGGTTAYTADLNPHSKIISVTASGTAGNPITIGSYGTGKAIIYGGITIPTGAWVANDPAAGVYSYTTPWGALLIWEDSVALKHASSSACDDGNWFADASKIYYKPTAGVLSDHIIETYHNAGVDTNNHDYITVDGLSFSKIFYGVINNSAHMTNATHITVQNNSFTNMVRGVFLGNENSVDASIVVKNNTFDYVTEGIMIGGTGQNDNVGISNNSMTNCSAVYGTSNYDSTSIFSSRLDTEGIGVQNLTNSDIHSNTIAGVCRGIVSFVYGGATGHDQNIYRNHISTSGTGLYLMPATNATGYYNINVHHNVLNNCGMADEMPGAIIILSLDSPTGQWNNLMNNTIIGGPKGILFSPHTGHSDVYWNIKNNIFYNSTYYIWELGPTTATKVVYDNNLYYPDKAKAFYSTVGNRSFAQWQAIDGNHDANSPTPVNPLFVSSSDFSLLSTSPAINAGVDVGLTSDYAGNPIVGAPDIGAYEYQGAVTDTTPPAAPTGLAVQ